MATAVHADPNLGRGVVLYDGTCAFCRKGVGILKRLDWAHKLAFVPAQDEQRWPDSPVPLDPSRMMEEMHVVTADRKDVHAGFSAFRWIAARVPLLWAMYPLLFVPGVPRLGQRAYLWIAKNRYSLVPCHDGQCKIPPRPRKK